MSISLQTQYNEFRMEDGGGVSRIEDSSVSRRLEVYKTLPSRWMNRDRLVRITLMMDWRSGALFLSLISEL